MTEKINSSKPPRKKKGEDFDNLAMVETTLNYQIFEPKTSEACSQPFNITADSTAALEFSLVRNPEYSQQIIQGVRNNFNFEKLQKFKEKNPKRYLEEAKDQVDAVCSGIEALTSHSNLFTVSFLIAGGNILNDVEDHFNNMQKKGGKKKYMSWIRSNFGDERMRYFQHAKQLANMGQFALD